MNFKVLIAVILMSLQGTEVTLQNTSIYDITFDPVFLLMGMGNTSTATAYITPAVLPERYNKKEDIRVIFYVTDTTVATVSSESFNNSEVGTEDGTYTFRLNVTSGIIGRSEVCAEGKDATNLTIPTTCLNVTVIRNSGTMGKFFTYIVILLVVVLYLSTGTVLSKTQLAIFKNPTGPIIGLVTQFLLMPPLAFGIAKVVISNPIFKLALFIVACCPGGGASTLWTVILGGNIELSILMTSASTLLAFLMMPMWIQTLGYSIVSEADLQIPFGRIALCAGTTIFPLGLGFFIQRKYPAISRYMLLFLKPFSIFLMVFIIVFAIITNAYFFQLFTFQIMIAGAMLPWIGTILGGTTAGLCRRNWTDILAIGLETGVCNTGLAVFVLKLSLPHPDSDIATVIPVAVALMTPVLPIIFILGKKIWFRLQAFLKKREDVVLAAASAVAGSVNDIPMSDLAVY
ncbi:unnamed protein product [Orchesella dallaii]|uniref:Ileal sodium/bile acid cotransporter n=1 Tax=Orchesella dallaii TaxID=48710 RepID=A0ABP1RST0_9HEXA